MSVRRLVSTRREVPASLRAGYDAAWESFRREVTARDAHAWRFASVSDPSLLLEFLEFRDDPRRDPPVSDALEALERCAPGHRESWHEA